MSQSTSPPLPSTTNVIHSVDQSQSDHFALLRDTPERLPSSIRRILGKSTYGMNWDLAHHVPLSSRGSFWLVPGFHVLCLLHTETIHEVTSACASTKIALAHGIVAVSLRQADATAPAKRLIVGVAPDGASKAVIHTNGTASRVAIINHLFVLKDSVNEPPEVVSLN